MKLKPFVCSIIVALSSSVQAQIIDDGLSPFERFLLTDSALEGAYDSYDQLYCSQAARQKFIDHQIPKGHLILSKGAFIDSNKIIGDINNLFKGVQNMLLLWGDQAIKGRHVCTGMFHDPEAKDGNASSMVAGYLVFDYRIFQKLFDLPQERRSFKSQDFVILHEVAHQLQFWNEDEEMLRHLNRQQNARVSELAADCVAGAMFKALNYNMPKDLYDMSIRGAAEAAYAVGDDNVTSMGHHGKPTERYFLASFGSSFVQSRSGNSPLVARFTSKELLEHCNRVANGRIVPAKR